MTVVWVTLQAFHGRVMVRSTMILFIGGGTLIS